MRIRIVCATIVLLLLVLLASLMVWSGTILQMDQDATTGPFEGFTGSGYIYPDESSVQSEIEVLKAWVDRDATPCTNTHATLPINHTSSQGCNPITNVTGALLLNNDTRNILDQCILHGLPNAEHMQCSSAASAAAIKTKLHLAAADG